MNSVVLLTKLGAWFSPGVYSHCLPWAYVQQNRRLALCFIYFLVDVVLSSLGGEINIAGSGEKAQLKLHACSWSDLSQRKWGFGKSSNVKEERFDWSSHSFQKFLYGYLLSSVIVKYLFLGNLEDKRLIMCQFLLQDENNFKADLQWSEVISEDIRLSPKYWVFS